MAATPGTRMEVVKDADAGCELAASIILDRIASRPGMSLLMPTGTSPPGVYARLREQSPDTFERVTFFNLDEYVQSDGNGGYRMIDPAHPQSYRRYMREQVLDAQPNIISHFPGIDNHRHPGTYDRFIRSLGGIQLALNGLGKNGHVLGFNEPGSSRDSVTRLTRLAESTVGTNGELTGSAVPRLAITTGIATGMAADEIITLAFGERKAPTVRRAINDEISSTNPSTFLQEHTNHLWIVDEAAASEL